MRRSSILLPGRVAFVTILACLGVLAPAHAAEPDASSPASAANVATAATAPIELAPDAPDRYVVVRGDTLWDIAGRFLRKPWRWPEIWEMNREEIRNPHWIYPGDIILLDRSGPTPRLRLAYPVGDGDAAGQDAVTGGAGLPVEKRSPDVRSGQIEREAIPTIPSALIAPFLNRALIVDENGLDTHPRIVATQDGRVNLGAGDFAWVRGLDAGAQPQGTSGSRWQIYRPARPLIDPDTRRTIAWEALYLGSGQLEREGDPASLRIRSATEEIGVGDRLMPAERTLPIVYTPHPPQGEVSGRIVAVYRGLSQVGRSNVVALNLGTTDGLERGHVLQIRHRGQAITDRTNGGSERIVLPSVSIGHLLVFRVFDKIAYGLVMDASQPIAVGDDIATP